ncbi:MAG: hypothetical protein AABW89_04765 [Nanoarchaeota archaeon]
MKWSYIGGEKIYGMMTMMRYSFAITLVFLLITTLTVNVSAIRLNEIESNPEGDDAGFEWVELYSEDFISLEGYVLDHDGRGGVINLSGSFQGFFIIDFSSQWLRNSNETVYLKFNGEIIDSTNSFSDNKVEKTHSFCDGEWRFTEPTKNEENSCGNSHGNINNSNKRDSKKEEKNRELPKIENLSSETAKKEPLNVPLKKISLNSQSDNEEIEITRTYKTRIGVIYFFIGFCVLLVVLIATRKL